MKGLEDFFPHSNEEKTRFSGTEAPARRTVVGYVGLDQVGAVGARYGTPLYVHLRGQEGRPGTNAESRRSLVPRVPDPEKRHMLPSISARFSQRRTNKLRARVMAMEDEPTNRRKILATDRHLCVHTIGSFGLLGLGHSFHVPQLKVDRMRTGKTGAFVFMDTAAWQETSTV